MVKIVRKSQQKNRLHHYRAQIVKMKAEFEQWERWAEYANRKYWEVTGRDIPHERAVWVSTATTNDR